MPRSVVVGMLALAAAASFALAPGSHAGVPDPVGSAGEIPPGKTLVVVGQGDPPTFAEHAAATGRAPAGVMAYSHLGYSREKYAKEFARTKETLEMFPGAILNLGLTMGNSVVFTSLGGDPKPPGAGSDLIKAADGARDRVICNRGRRDKVIADRKDRVGPACDIVRIRRGR